MACDQDLHFLPYTPTLSVCVCVGGGGVGGEGGGGYFLYMAQYGCACRMAPFFSAAKYMIGPFFQQKVYDWPHFSELVYESPHFSDVSRYMHIFFSSKIFRGY